MVVMADQTKKEEEDKSRPMYFWTEQESQEWLKKRRPKFAVKYGEVFAKNCIKGRVLIDLTDRDLKKLGIRSPDERQVLLHEIQKEKLHSYLKELTELSTP